MNYILHVSKIYFLMCVGGLFLLECCPRRGDNGITMRRPTDGLIPSQLTKFQ